MNESINNLRLQLKTAFFEMDEAIDGLFIALLSKQNMVMLGPPGTAKSLLTRVLCRQIEGANYFGKLLTKYSTPEEVFGPRSIKGMEQDKFYRVTSGFLPTAHIAFLDEIFKASSSILNTLLWIINERIYSEDGSEQPTPLISLFGAANEMPDQGEELGAIWDRFMLRYLVDYIQEDSNFMAMLRAGNPQDLITDQLSMTLVELAQKEVDDISISESILEIITNIRRALWKEEGIQVSNRRGRELLGLLKANAYLNESDVVDEEHLDILCHCLWSEPSQIKTVAKKVMALVSPYKNMLMELADQAKEIYDNALKDKTPDSGVEANAKFQAIQKRIEEIRNNMKKANKAHDIADKLILTVNQYISEVLFACCGLNIKLANIAGPNPMISLTPAKTINKGGNKHGRSN